MRTLYIVAPGTGITPQVKADATAAGATEVAQGIPPRLLRDGVTGTYPFVYTEPDDPEKTPFLQSVQVLKQYFNEPSPTNAQSVQAIKALIRVMKKVVSELR